jgi:hypothetical protein
VPIDPSFIILSARRISAPRVSYLSAPYEEEVVLYMEICGDEKWQKSRWGKAAMEKAGEGY